MSQPAVHIFLSQWKNLWRHNLYVQKAYGLLDFPWDSLCSSTRSGLRIHIFKYHQQRCNIWCRQHAFSVQVVPCWSKLPAETMAVPVPLVSLPPLLPELIPLSPVVSVIFYPWSSAVEFAANLRQFLKVAVLLICVFEYDLCRSTTGWLASAHWQPKWM